ncbi:hypothetical protein Dimus_000671 [Dionaea muscipula]
MRFPSLTTTILNRRKRRDFGRSSSPPSPSHMLRRPLATVPSRAVTVKNRETPILDLDVSLVTDHALDSLGDADSGTPNAVAAFTRASSVELLVAAITVECLERHVTLLCCRRVM